MTALPYQPVPTAAQRRELERLLASDRAKRHAVRQYADNQPKQALISPVEAAGVACCATDRDEDEAPAMFGMVDALRTEFGRAWPVYLGTYLILCALAVVLTLILTGVIHA